MARQDKAYKQLTDKIYKVPYCIQDTIPINRIAENGIFELEDKEGFHLFDRMYLFEDINYQTQDEKQKKATLEEFKQLLNAMNVSYKISIVNHYSGKQKLRESILNRTVSEGMEELANEYRMLHQERVQNGRNGLEQSKYFIISCRKPDYESAKSYFFTLETSLQDFFTNMGSNLIPLNATERLRALHGFYRMGEEDNFSFDWNEYLSLKRDWRNDIINISLKEHKDYLEMEDGRVACTLFVRRYASGLDDRFLKEIADLSFPLILTVDSEPMDHDYAYKLVMKKYMGTERSIIKQQEMKNKNNDFSSDISYEKRRQKEEAEDMLDDLRSYDERLFYVGITILIQAESKKELEQRKEEIKFAGSKYNMEIVSHSFRQLDAMNTTLPTSARFVDTMRSLTTSSLAMLTPFNVQEINHPEGFSYGWNQKSKNLILGNRKLLDNGNGFIFAPSGKGKSMQAKFEMGQVHCFTEDDIIVIDPMGEYRDIAEKWNGAYYNLSQSEENVFYCNPFHVPDIVEDETKFIAEKAEFAYAICEKAIKPEALTNIHISVIDRAVREMYLTYFKQHGTVKKKGVKSPTLKTMCEYMGMQSDSATAQNLISSLEVFTEGTLNIFAREQTESENNRFTVFGFPDLGKRMCEMAMLVMLETITSRIKYNQSRNVATWVYVDEIHRIWDDEYAEMAIEKMWREVRKRGGICTGMSQNVIDGLRNRSTQTMVSNSEFTLLLDQGVVDKAKVSELFKVSDELLKYVNGAKVGSGLVRFGSKIVPFDNTIDRNNKLFKLYNTDFHDKKEPA